MKFWTENPEVFMWSGLRCMYTQVERMALCFSRVNCFELLLNFKNSLINETTNKEELLRMQVRGVYGHPVAGAPPVFSEFFSDLFPLLFFQLILFSRLVQPSSCTFFLFVSFELCVINFASNPRAPAAVYVHPSHCEGVSAAPSCSSNCHFWFGTFFGSPRTFEFFLLGCGGLCMRRRKVGFLGCTYTRGPRLSRVYVHPRYAAACTHAALRCIDRAVPG